MGSARITVQAALSEQGGHMSIGIYLVGYLVLIAGIAIIHGVTVTRHKDPPARA